MKKTLFGSLIPRFVKKSDVKHFSQNFKEFVSKKSLLLGLGLISAGSAFAQSPGQKPEAPLWGITYYEPLYGNYISCENHTTCHVNLCIGDTLWLCPDEQPATNAHIYWYATVNGQPDNYTTPFCTSSYNSPSPAGCGFAGYFVPTAAGVYNINYNAFGNVNWYDNSFGSLQVTVNAMPNYAISANPNPSTIYTQPVAFTLTPPAQGLGNSYDLFFGDGYDVGTVSTANHTYGATGVYNACVLFSDSNGFCSKNVCKTITVSNPTLTASMTTNTSTCGGSSVTAQGYYSGNVTPDHYYWEITQTDQYGNVTSPGYTWSSWFPGAPVSGSTFTFPGSSTLPCNKYYRITFAVQNTTIPGLGWEATTTFIYVNCPPAPVFTGNLDICAGSSTTLCVNNYLPSSLYTITWNPSPRGAIHNQCITVSPTTTTTYSATVTNNSTRCSGTAAVTVHVYNNNPSFSTANNTSNSSYYTVTCTANDLTATSEPGFGYSWIVEDLTAASTYTVTNPSAWWTFPSTSFCGLNPIGGSYSGNVNTSIINSNCSASNPSIGHYQYNHTYRITRGTWNTYCSWAQASITFSVPPSPHLAAGNNAANMTVIAENSGPDYSYTKNAGETAVKTALANDETMTLFPNPSKGILNVRLENPSEEAYMIEVFDMYGKLMYRSEKLATDRSGFVRSVDLSGYNLVKGIYLVNLRSDKKILSQKLIVE